MRLGAMAYLSKPVEREALDSAFSTIHGFIDRKVRNLLVVEDDDLERKSIVELIGNGDVKTTAVATGQEALSALESQDFDCLVLDLGLSDMTGFELLERMKASPRLSQTPVIVYTGKDLTKRQETELRRLAETIIIKDVKSPDQLLDETIASRAACPQTSAGCSNTFTCTIRRSRDARHSSWTMTSGIFSR